ncbi:MAG: glycosyltransferase family 2 protein [Candidatus Hodarchaeota archaeon]
MESDGNSKVSIAVLTYNRSILLKNLLLSLQELKYKPVEIIVIDNHSEDNTEEMLGNEFTYVNYIRTERNIGASARNLGLKRAMGDIVITLDDDIIGIDDNDLANLLSAFRSRPTLGAVNFKVLDHSTGNICNWPHHCKPEEYSNREFLTYEITEGAVAFRKKALEKAGYYPEYFFLSHEGPDLALRIINTGYQVIYSNMVSVIHYRSNFGREPWLNYYFDTRNQLWLATRNFPVPYAITYLTRGVLSMFVYSARDGYLLYWMKGLIDGLKGLKKALKDRNVLSDEKLRIIKSIDRHRPDFTYLIKKRLLKRGVRL